VDGIVLHDGRRVGITWGRRAVATRWECQAAVAADPPDVVVLDIRMPPTHTDVGLRAALDLRKNHPGVGVLLFSLYIETRYARELFGSGRCSG
jgi:DNA-binding NarL/FixJ family response regulator